MKSGIAGIAAAAMLGACSGSMGMEGASGPQGPQGERGPQGPQGTAGPQGGTGAQGPAGPAGATGPQGDTGLQGPAGPQGVQGPQGAIGPMGPQGPQGVAGPTGPTGPTGTTGPTGPVGAKGDAGPRGEQGPTGLPGQLFTPTGAAVTLVGGSVATAPTDGTRLVTGTNTPCTAPRTTGCFLTTGPFVLTDARAVDRGNLTFFFTLPLVGDCSTVTCFGTLGPSSAAAERLIAVGSATTSGFQFPSSASGARYFVPPDRRLCICATQIGLADNWRVSWSGFVPYQ